MIFELKFVKDWKIHESHWCDNHKVVEYSEAWVTKGKVSVLTPEPLVFYENKEHN